jgi:hypothetical protein
MKGYGSKLKWVQNFEHQKYFYFVHLGFSSTLITSVTSAELSNNLVAKPLSGLPGSQVTLTFNGVTDKESSS